MQLPTKQTMVISSIILLVLGAVFLYPYYKTNTTIKTETKETDTHIKSLDHTLQKLPTVFTQTQDETERRITNAHNTIQEETRTQTPQLVVSNLNRELDLFLAEHTRRSVDIRP